MKDSNKHGSLLISVPTKLLPAVIENGKLFLYGIQVNDALATPLAASEKQCH